MLKHIAALTIAAGLFTAPALAQNAGHVAKAKAGKSCANCNLFQADLAYRDGSNMNLSASRLRQSNLSLTTFDNANLSGANLSVANLFGARFNRANMTKTNLSQVSAVGTYFGSSNMSGANLSGANLSGADLSLVQGLSQSQLNRACGDRSTRLPAGKTIPRCR
jgi:uncharacterized protein YjbI with pentapeptide repeats